MRSPIFNRQATLTPAEARRVLNGHADGVSIDDLARRFGVSAALIGRVIRAERERLQERKAG